MWFGVVTTTRYGVGPGLSRKSGSKKHFPLTAGSDDRYTEIKRRVFVGGFRQRSLIGSFSAGDVPARIRSRLPVSDQQTCPAVTSQSSPDNCWSQRLLSSTGAGSSPVPHERPSLRGPPCVVRLPVRAPVLRHPRHKEGPAESPQEGGRSEVKRSRAGSSHGEPRTESPSEAAPHPTSSFAPVGYPRWE